MSADRDRNRYHLPKLTGVKVCAPQRYRGMPAFVPSEAQRRVVEKAAANGVGVYEIAQIIINPVTGRSVNQKTLRKHMRQELMRGWAKANLAVAESAYLQAIGMRKAVLATTGEEVLIPCKPVPRMTIWWEMTRTFAAQRKESVSPGVIIVRG